MIYLKGIATLIICFVISYYIIDYNKIKTQNTVLTSQVNVLELEIKNSNDNFKFILANSNRLAEEKIKLEKENTKLSEKLSQLEGVIEKGAEKHPKLISKILTNSVKNLNTEIKEATK